MPPAVYVDRDEFRRRTGDKATGANGELDSQCETAARAIDRELGVAPGMFAPSTGTFRFSAMGGVTLYLRDAAGWQYFLRTVDANSIAIDSDFDGSFDDYLWDLSDAWVRGIPENAVTFGEAFTALELNPYLSTSPLSVWPTGRDTIRITGTWGFATTPGAITELCVDMIKNLRMGALTGGAGTAVFAEEMPLSASMYPVLQRLKANYNQRMPV